MTGPTSRSRWLAVASTLLWTWAVVMLLIIVAIAYPSIVTGRDVALATVVPLGMVILSGVSAFGVRRQRKPFHVVAIVSGLLWISALQSWKILITPVGTILNVLVIGIVVVNWRRFSRVSPSPDSNTEVVAVADVPDQREQG